MTRDEVKQLLMTTQAYFPNFRVDDKTATINAWYIVLQNKDANEIMTAFYEYVNEGNTAFAPSISQLVAPSNIRSKQRKLLNIQNKGEIPLLTTQNSSYRITRPMDTAKILEMFGLIENYYGNFDYNTEKAEIWLTLFKDCDYDAIMHCLRKYAKTNIYPPAPAGILNLYNEGKEKLKNWMLDEYNTVHIELAEVNVKDGIYDNIALYEYTLSQISEMDRYDVSKRTTKKLSEYLDEHQEYTRDVCFDFGEWLRENL